MKRRYFVILGIVCVVWWLPNSFQGAQVQPFDLKKCQQELEVMKGILRTTLGFASQELAAAVKSDGKVETKNMARRLAFGRYADFNIGAFYLAGQGAVFTIPTASVREMMRARQGNLAFAYVGPDMKDRGWNGAWVEQLANQLTELNVQLQENFEFGSFPASAPPTPSPASPVPAPKPPRPAEGKSDPAAATAAEKQLRQKLSELQEKVRERGAEEEARQARFRESLSQLKAFLVEAMANHGDSLSVVKPGEYVNVVLVDEGNRWFVDEAGDRVQREILSVQKSVITEYKTGKLSLEAFKQRVVNYVN